MYGKILVVAAHPDDDCLGAGAVLSFVSSHVEIKTVYMSNGVGSRGNPGDGEIEARLDAMERANKIMGIQSWEVGLFEDQRFDVYPIIELTQYVEKFVKDYNPSTVITHSKADLNRDHRLTFEAVMTACRPLVSSDVKYIYSFEVPSATEWGFETFKPNVWYSGNFSKKIAAVNEYKSEIPKAPHPRSIEGIWCHAITRGSECGRPAAEAFELVRCVI